MISSFRRMLPAIPKGYALAPSASWFSVLTPIARTNLVTNPSFELATTSWTAIGGSIARVATQQYHGVYSLQITPTAATTDGARFDTVTTVTGQLYAVSCKCLGVAGVKYKISLATTGGVDLAAYTFVATGRWQWVYVYYQETAGTTRRIVVSKATSTNTGVFYIDGVQCEAIAAGEYVSTYIDGDQVGLVPNQLPPAYLWTGTPHGSTSTRSGQTRAGGMAMRLDFYGFVLLAMIGLGLPTPVNVSVPYVLLDGAQYERTQKPPRQFTLAGRWDSASFPQLQRQIGDLGAALDRDTIGQQQPLTLLYQALDSCDAPISDPARIICSYQGGLEGVTDNLHAEQASVVMKMWMPLIQGDGESGASLGVQTSVANANNILYRSPSGVWSAMGTGATGGTVGVFAVVAGLDGSIFAAGDFTAMGGVANTKNIARWDGTAWNAVGTGVTGGAGVFMLAVGPDGSIYAAGSFTAMGGVANTSRIAKWNGSAWSALGTGAASGNVNALAFGADGALYAGGSFPSMGGAANTAGVAKWNGSAWSSITSIIAGTAVYYAARGPDGSIYFVGNFTQLGVASNTNYVARYNPLTAAWNALSTGLAGGTLASSIAVARDGRVYVGGDFTTAGGIASQSIAVWNGTAWGTVASSNPFASKTVAEGGLALWPDGSIAIGGNMTTANGVTLPDSLTRWNGAVFLPFDVDLPGVAGTAIISALYGAPDGSTYIGWSATGTATAAATTTVTNVGSAKAYPTLTIKGPTAGTSRIYQLLNTTTGRSIYLNLTINAGETVTLRFTPDNLSFVSDFQGNVASTILQGSNEADFFLQPGANTISFLAADSTVTATLRFRPQYNAVSDLTP